MKNFLKRTFTDGKNIVFTYYVENLINYSIPKVFFRYSLKNTFKDISMRADYHYIVDRVNYYNKLTAKEQLSAKKVQLKNFLFKRGEKIGSRYYFDTYEHIKYFDQKLYFDHLYGDITYTPDTPKIIKSRPIGDSNKNSILLNLDKLRHFVFINDKKSFREKENKAIFLSYIIGKPHRIDFMRKFHGSSFCICGDVCVHHESLSWYNNDWYHEKISLWEHLKYKFILAIEGNDVATNLKWIMSSNSIAVMPKPKYETWFMEGKLIADHHYIVIKDDYSDFEQKMDYYIKHPEKAEEIIKNANEYINQFQDAKREKIISHLVLQKYFENTY